jgi:hypothetical protein
MQKQELEIIIDSDGKVSVKVAGVKGGDCLEVTKELEEALGEVETREHTAEFYERESDGVQKKIGLK